MNVLWIMGDFMAVTVERICSFFFLENVDLPLGKKYF